MGREVVVAITDGRLDFVPWEQILYGEFDGRRRKRVLVKIISKYRPSELRNDLPTTKLGRLLLSDTLCNRKGEA
jgi:hypothetical protein